MRRSPLFLILAIAPMLRSSSESVSGTQRPLPASLRAVFLCRFSVRGDLSSNEWGLCLASARGGVRSACVQGGPMCGPVWKTWPLNTSTCSNACASRVPPSHLPPLARPPYPWAARKAVKEHPQFPWTPLAIAALAASSVLQAVLRYLGVFCTSIIALLRLQPKRERERDAHISEYSRHTPQAARRHFPSSACAEGEIGQP